MQRRGTVWRLAAALALTLLLAACGGAEETDTATDATSEDPAAASEPGAEAGSEMASEPMTGGDVSLVEEGALTVCTDSPYQPFEFEEDGEFTGFDVELIREVADDLGVEAQFQVTPFDAIQSGAALSAQQCDVAASAITITEERRENLGFSEPYFNADQSLLIAEEDEDTYASLDDLAGATVGVQAATTGQMYAEENAPADTEIVEFPDSSALFTALQGGQIDAILQDFPVNGFFATQNEGVVVTERFPTGEQYGFATTTDNTALLEAIDGTLADLEDSGRYDEIFSTWFGPAPDERAS